VNSVMLFLASAGSNQQATQGSPWGFLVPLVIIFFIMYILVFRPQSKKQKEHREMITKLEKGDRVMTAGGIIGTIAGIRDKDNVVILQVAKPDIKIEVARTSIARKLVEEAEEA
jgi:preprotein translocase subunit YajC